MEKLRNILFAALCASAVATGTVHAQHFGQQGPEMQRQGPRGEHREPFGDRYRHRFDDERRDRRPRGISYVAYRGGSLERVGRGVWQELDRRGRPVFFFEEIYRARGLIGLWDATRRVELTIDLRDGMIYYKEGRRGRERPLYPIIDHD